ncbi:hypothetical protein Tco_1118552 [Tanacetum coccineum]
MAQMIRRLVMIFHAADLVALNPKESFVYEIVNQSENDEICSDEGPVKLNDLSKVDAGYRHANVKRHDYDFGTRCTKDFKNNYDFLWKGFLSRVGSDEQILDEPHLDSSSI